LEKQKEDYNLDIPKFRAFKLTISRSRCRDEILLRLLGRLLFFDHLFGFFNWLNADNDLSGIGLLTVESQIVVILDDNFIIVFVYKNIGNVKELVCRKYESFS
jgi:hypothetical protein